MRSNPFIVGDIVVLPHRGNGTAEGVLWQVTKKDKIFVWIKPVYTVTGRSVLRPKKRRFESVEKFGLPDLAMALKKLHSLTISYFRSTSGLTEENQPEITDSKDQL